MASRTVGADAFASALGEIFGDIKAVSCDDLLESVRDGSEEAKQAWRDGAPVRTGDYRKSIRYRVEGTEEKPESHVYSTKPGLPHLLEKGHATIGGGRVPGRPHVAPAAERGFQKAYESLVQRLEADL